MPRLRENVPWNFEFKNEATRAHLQVKKRILIWWPSWNKVYATETEFVNTQSAYGLNNQLI